MRLIWRLVSWWRWLHPPPEGIYRQQLARFETAESEITPLKLPPVKPLKAQRESARIWQKLRRCS